MTTYHNGLAFTDDAQHVCLNSLPADYRYLDYPTISGIPASKLSINSNSGTLEMLAYTVDAGDDAAAATRIASGLPDQRLLYPGSSESISLPAGISTLYLLAIGYGGTDTTPANGIVDSSTVVNWNGGATVGAVAALGVTSAQILGATSMIRMDFDTANVDRKVTLTMSQTFDSGKRAVVEVEGASYA